MAAERNRYAFLIDASSATSELRVFGMSLVERQLAAIGALSRGPRPACEIASIVIEHAAGAAPSIRAALLANLPVRLAPASGDLSARLTRAAAEASVPLIVLPGDAIVDSRVLALLVSGTDSAAALGGEGAQRSALLRLAPGAKLAQSSAADLRVFAEAQLAADALPELALDAVEAHIVDLRRDQAPYAFRIAAADVATTERFLFWSNYKGSTDFMTRWVFPPFVWALVRPLARWRVHPNWVTALGVALCFGAIPLWAAGDWALGFAAAYTMAVLDSVDGKLARLTYTTSAIGNVLDHGTDIVHPPFWYAAWAWGLAGGPIGASFELTLWMFLLYTLDRLLPAIFRQMTGKSIHGYAPVDVRWRTWISRRNVNLPVFTLALPLGLGAEAIALIVAWQGVCFVFHAVRVVQVWRDRAVAA